MVEEERGKKRKGNTIKSDIKKRKVTSGAKINGRWIGEKKRRMYVMEKQ